PAGGSCCPPGAAGGVCPRLFFSPPLPWRGAPLSTPRGKTQHEGTAYQRGMGGVSAFPRETNAGPQTTLRGFPPVDCRATRAGGHAPHACDEQHASLDRKLDILRLDAG